MLDRVFKLEEIALDSSTLALDILLPDAFQASQPIFRFRPSKCWRVGVASGPIIESEPPMKNLISFINPRSHVNIPENCMSFRFTHTLQKASALANF